MDRGGPKLTDGVNWTKWDRSRPNWTDVDLIGLNENCLIFRENKLSLINFREKIIHYIKITK